MTSARSNSEPITVSYQVEGMDCAACVQKVERVVSQLPGTAGIKASFSRQSLALSLDEAQTSRSTLEQHLRDLGYRPQLEGQGTPAPSVPTAARTPWRAWLSSSAGRPILVSALLLACAWLLGHWLPAWASGLYGVVTGLGVWPLARKAWHSARLGEPFSIQLLVTVAALGAILIGEAAEGAVVVFLFAVGEWLEGLAAGKARAGIQALAALSPQTARLWHDNHAHEVPLSEVKVGDLLQIQPGGRVPTDGRIVQGSSHLDESPVTGESLPVHRRQGDTVYAGSLNAEGVLIIEASKTAADNTIAQIVHLVEEAESHQAKTARIIERFSRWYTPLVMLVALLVAVMPPLLAGAQLFGAEGQPWLYRGLALLLIGCPCALVLSVPAAITSGITAGARRGLLIKGGAALEALGQLRTVAFDKTGTLTRGTPQLTDLLPLDRPEAEVLRLAAALERGSSHPLAKAVLQAAQTQNITIPAAQDARALPGQGIEAQVEGQKLWLSSPSSVQLDLSDALKQRIQSLEQSGKTVVLLHDAHTMFGVLAFRDELRPEAVKTVRALKGLGVQVLMLTGDNARTGNALGQQLGLEVHAELRPADKLRLVSALGHSGPVAMIGDGINDAPALAQATVGVAMGGGTAVALETADAALLGERVSGVPELIQLSRDTRRNIGQNIAFALGLKLIFLVTTLLGYTNLWLAILADTGATALVTANALRLLRWRSPFATLHE